MANIYCRSAATGLANGTTWADAYTTLVAALAVAINADIIWVADDHAEVKTGSAMTLVFPTTPGLKVLCANTHVTEPPTGLATTASVAMGAASFGINLSDGFGYIYGINFLGGTNNSVSCTVGLANGGNHAGYVLDNCVFQIRSISSGAVFYIGPGNNSGVDDVLIRLISCQFKFATTVQYIYLLCGYKEFINMSLDGAGAIPTTLFKIGLATEGETVVEDSNLSALAFTNLLDWGVANSTSFYIRNCKLPSSVNIVTGTNPGVGGSRVFMHNCDSADTNYRFAEHSWQGSTVQQTGTLVRTGGATDGGGTLYSYKMIGSANAASGFNMPLYSPEFSIYNTTVASSKTLTVEILTDTATNLKDNEVWLEVHYLGTSGFPVGTLISDRVSSAIATAADQTASTATWDTTGMTNPNKQKLSVTFTPQKKGYFIARVALAKNITTYVDPYITVA